MRQGQKNWDYSHTEHAWPVCHVFMPGSKQLNDFPTLKQKLNILQQVEGNNHLRGGIVNLYNLTDTSWIVAMHKMGFRYACVWFDGCWSDTDDFNHTLLHEIDRLNEEEDWLCSGQINTRAGEYPFFTRSLILLNIETWLNVDQPNPFINPGESPNWMSVAEQLDYEDSSYGIRVRPEESTEDTEKQSEWGNAWIAWSLRRRLWVPGLSTQLMDTTTFVRPLLGTNELEQGFQRKPYEDTELSYASKRILDRLYNVGSPIYFVNTEDSRPEIVEQLEGSVFEQYVGPCAGFKLLYYAHKYGFNSDTEFVFYDFDKDSVDFKRTMLETWNGQDYETWVDAWCEANPGKNLELQYLVKERWPTVLHQFGGHNGWTSFWNKFKQCKWRVEHCDLIKDTLELKSARTFFWTSNIYSYLPVKLSSAPFEVEQSFMNNIQLLNKTHPDSWFCGTDINDNELMCPSRAVLTVGDNNTIGFE